MEWTGFGGGGGNGKGQGDVMSSAELHRDRVSERPRVMICAEGEWL
jgi:hypothetical protein